MTVVSFTEQDLLRGKIVEPAWQRMKIDAVNSALSKDQGSTNHKVEGTIIRNADNGDEQYQGVPIIWNFNSKAMGFSKGFLEALGVTVEAGKRYDLKAAEGEIIDVFVENGMYEGRPKNEVNHKYRTPKSE